MKKYKTDANAWMRENGLSWGPKKQNHGGDLAKLSGPKHRRLRRSKILGDRIDQFKSVKDFCEENRKHKGHDCLFVPAAHKGRAATLSFCGKTIAASRYMTLLTHGTPKSEDMIHRHLCGNGHLSCVNPNHLVWGTRGDNQADANKHRKAGENVQDRIHAID